MVMCALARDQLFPYNALTGEEEEPLTSDHVLRLRRAIVRFDPLSGVPSGEMPPTGSIVVSEKGFAVHRRPRVEGHAGCEIIYLDGSVAKRWRLSDPAFTRWQLGVLRGDRFETIAALSV